MKKSKIKFAIKKSISEYYKSGLTRTASAVKEDILKAIDKLYLKK